MDMHPALPSLRLVGLVVSIVLATCGGEPTPPPAAPPPATLDGAVRLSGFVADPGSLSIKARPLNVVVMPKGAARVSDDVKGGTLSATRVVATGDPHVLRFHFDGLVSGTAYQLGIGGGSSSTTVKWRAPKRGWIVAGHDASLDVEGFHPSSELEVLAHRSTGDVWVGADAQDLASGASARKLRVRSSVPNATQGTLQIATDPFLAGRGCQAARGVIHSETVNLARDFINVPDLDVRRVLATAWTPSPTAPNVPSWYRAVARGAPLYMRVVPLVNGAPACSADEGEPGSILLAALHPAATLVPFDASLTFSGVYTPAQGVRAPANAAFCVSVTKAHTLPTDPWGAFGSDWFGAVTVLAHPDFGGSTMVPGDFFCFPPPDSDGFFDSLVNGFSSLVTGAIDAIGAVVNTVAAIWEEIKGVVVNFVADAIGALGIPCDDTCREGITLGLNVGLAALGLPPSLPNFDQLSEQGLDYLVAEAAEQYGVPPEAASAIVHEVVSDMQASHDSGLGPGADWIMLDDGFRHATVVANVSAGPFATLPDDVILISDSIFQASVVPLPKAPLASGKTLLVPMVLPLDLTGLAEPPSVTFFGTTTYLVDVARWYRSQWFVKQLGAFCVQSQVFALKTDPAFGIPMVQSRMAAFGFNAFVPSNVANGTTNCP